MLGGARGSLKHEKTKQRKSFVRSAFPSRRPVTPCMSLDPRVSSLTEVHTASQSSSSGASMKRSRRTAAAGRSAAAPEEALLQILQRGIRAQRDARLKRLLDEAELGGGVAEVGDERVVGCRRWPTFEAREGYARDDMSDAADAERNARREAENERAALRPTRRRSRGWG